MCEKNSKCQKIKSEISTSINNEQLQIKQTSGQRILTKGCITPTLVTPAAGDSILKPHFCTDALSPVDKSAAP